MSEVNIDNQDGAPSSAEGSAEARDVHLAFYLAARLPSEDCVRSELSLKFACKRVIDPKRMDRASRKNPGGLLNHHIIVTCAGKDITSIRIEDPTSIELPEWLASMKFEAKGKKLLVWTSSKVDLKGMDVPELRNPDCQIQMNNLAIDLMTRKLSGDSFQFVAILDDDEDIDAMQEFLTASNRDCDNDPMLRWIRNSPNEHHLQIGNIVPVHERPPFSEANLILRKRRAYQDSLEMKVHHVYAAENEYAYALGENAEWKTEQFQTSFCEVPASCFKENEDDNEEAKLIFACVSFEGKTNFDRPAPGDSFSAYFPFPVKPCPKYTGPYIKPTTVAEDEEEDYLPEASGSGEVILKNGPTAEEKAYREEELQQEQIETAIHTWKGTVLGPNKLVPNAFVAIVFCRPHDTRWLGPPGTAPRVSVDVPVHPSTFRNDKRFQLQVLEAHKNATSLILIPDFSRQTYKDTMGGMHSFFEQDREQMDTNIQQHLSEYLISFDDTLPFPTVNFLKDVACKKWEEYVDKLSPYQLDAFKKLVKIKHGALWVVGCVASAKTLFGLLMMVVAIANDDLIDAEGQKARNTCSYVTETNALVNQAASNMYEECKRHKLAKRIIRVHSIPGEKARLISKVVPFEQTANMVQAASMFLAEVSLNMAGHNLEEIRKAGDKRRDPSLSNMSLAEAMWDHSQDSANECLEFDQLRTHLKTMLRFPDAFTAKAEMDEEISKLMADTLNAADVLFMTTAAALRPTIAMTCKDRKLMLIDEVAKTSPPMVLAIIGKYAPTFFGFLGDVVQELPFCITAENAAFWNPFFRTSTYSILERAVDSDVAVIFLYQQFQLYMPALAAWVSHHFYKNMMVDGNAKLKELPVEYEFVRGVLNEHWNINDCWMMLLVRNTKGKREQGGFSISNAHLEHVAAGIISDFRYALANTGLNFQKSKFKIVVTTPYRACANNMEDLIAQMDATNLAKSYSSGKIQHLTAGVVVLVLPSEKYFTKFAGDVRRILVQITRGRYGLIVVASNEAFEAGSYNYDPNSIKMLKDQRIAHLYSLKLLAESQNILRLIDAPLLDT